MTKFVALEDLVDRRRPVIGSKSLTLKAYGYRQPSQPTTSSGCCG
jgi:hypothetical protein